MNSQLARQPLNGKSMDDCLIIRWANAIIKASAMIASGEVQILGTGKHPQTKAPFIVLPSMTEAGKVHYSVKSPSGYICVGCKAADGVCWHNAFHMLGKEHARAVAILAEAEALKRDAQDAAAQAKRAAAIPSYAANDGHGPRLFR